MSTVVGLFHTHDEAQRAVEALQAAGFNPDDVSLVMRDHHGEGETDATAAGAVSGGILGGLAGLLVGVGALAIPGIGPIVAAGPLATTLAGGALGAATGGLLGVLVDSGLAEEEAAALQMGVERGGILLVVHAPEGREFEARNILNRHGAHGPEDIQRRAEVEPDFTIRPHQTPELSEIRANIQTARTEPPAPKSAPAATAATTSHQDSEEQDTSAMTAGGLGGAVAGAIIGGLAGGPAGAAAGAALIGVAGLGIGAMVDYASAESEFHEHWQAGPHRDRFSWDRASNAYRYGWEWHDRVDALNRSWIEVRDELERDWPGPEPWPEVEPMVRTAWERRAQLQTQRRPIPRA